MTNYSGYSNEELEALNQQLSEQKADIRDQQLEINEELTDRALAGYKKVNVVEKKYGRSKVRLITVPAATEAVDGVPLEGIESEEEVSL